MKSCFDELQSLLPDFKMHIFIKRQQSEAFRLAKEIITDKQPVIQLDFSENLTIVSQDVIQSAHWISDKTDYLSHNRYAVAVFLDGAVSQFKQKFTLANITLFKDVQISWNFFARSHRKASRSVDGIGGMFKRMARRAIMARKLAINSSEDFVNFISMTCQISMHTKSQQMKL